MIEIKKPYFLIALFLLAAAALLAGGRFPYLFFYMALFLFLIPCLWLRLSLGRLSGDIEVSSTYSEVGQTLTVLYRVKNSSRGRFPYLELTNVTGSSFSTAAAENKLVTLSPGETVVYRREVKCSRRGIYDLKTFRVKTGDPFGIFQISKPLAAGKEIKVYPQLKTYPGAALPARQYFGNMAVKEKQYENYSYIADLREWQDGDSVKRIHWKQSARQERLVVKNYEPKADSSFNIFLDMCSSSYRHDRDHLLEDLAVEAAASLIYYGLKEGVPVQVFSELLPAGSLRGRHMRDYRKIMDRVIALSPAGRKDFAAFVHGYSYYLTPQSSLFLFTPRLNLSDAAAFLLLKQRGYFPVLFYPAFFNPGLEEPAMLKKLKEAGISVHTLHPPEENEDTG
ncbi:MAG TPA: DUF58 domain-containing protein [Bacillota bacterium]|nr:DUF58 domain-containing protein [Bacillota bacterium]HQE10503.1 DUF58 domain-containing protein [Bacillota bacterium]